MNQQSSLEHHQQGPFSDDIAVYQTIVSRLRAEVAAWPAALQPSIEASLSQFIPGEFGQVVALLPFWLRDVFPIESHQCADLGLAHLYGWWYYWAQDEILDGSQSADVLLTGHLALVRMLDLYAELGLRQTSCWVFFDANACQSAAAYAVELQARCQSLADLTPQRLEPLSIDLIIDRAAAFYFNSLAQASMAGFGPDHPRSQAIQTALRCFTAIRQINDDASDWIDDLKVGHVNPVAAAMIQSLYRLKVITTAEEISMERLGFYHVRAEVFWRDLEHQVAEFGATALAALQPFGQTRLQSLIKHQLGLNAKHWESARAHRAELRALFAL